MKIQVTTEHIKNGIRENGTESPVALAMRDKGFVPINGINYKDLKISHVCFPDWYWYQQLPYDVWVKIELFNSTGKMKPFEFEMK
jgi:hypothetical protein